MRDIPTENLQTGDVAMLVDHTPHPRGGEEAAILEVFNAAGESIAVATVPASAIGLLRADQVPAVRMLLQRVSDAGAIWVRRVASNPVSAVA